MHCSRTDNMSFLDTKAPAERETLVKEYVTAMKTVKQRNMVNREMKLAIGDELQTLSHPIVNATKQAAEETRKELEPMKETLTGIDRALTAQRVDATPLPSKNVDTIFGKYRRQDCKLATGKKIVQLQLNENKKILTVDGTVYDFTPGLHPLIMRKHPRPTQYNSNDYRVCKSLCAQTKVRSFPNPAGTARPHAKWKYKHLPRKMVIPGERMTEEGESEDSDDIDTASIGDSEYLIYHHLVYHHLILECYHLVHLIYRNRLPILALKEKLKRRRIENLFIKVTKGDGVVYLPGDINGLTKKLHLLAAEFFAGNTAVRNELVLVLDALLRVKTIDTNITARLAAYQSIRFAMRSYQYGGSGMVSAIGSLLDRCATKDMLTTAAKTAMRGTLDAPKSAVPHLIEHKVAITIADAAESFRGYRWY